MVKNIPVTEEDARRGSSDSEKSTPDKAGLSGYADSEEVSEEDVATDSVDAAPTVAETLLPGLPHGADDVVMEVMEALRDEQEVGTWVEFWELLMGEKGELFGETLEAIKDSLLNTLTLIEETVKILKNIINAAAAIAGWLLDMASMYLVLARSLLRLVRGILNRVMSLLEIPLLKSEMKVAMFHLFSGGLDPRKIDAMAPVVRAKLNEMTTTWMNRPVAEDQLCLLMFIPFSISSEAARVIGSAVRLGDLLAKLIQDLKFQKKPEEETSLVPEDLDRLEGILEFLVANYKNHDSAHNPEPVEQEILGLVDSAHAILDAILEKPVNEELARNLMFAYGTIATLEEGLARQSTSDFQSDPSEVIPGVGTFRSRMDDEDKKAVFESNFVNGQYRYLSTVYKVSSDGSVTELFADPALRFIKAVSIHPDLKAHMLSSRKLFKAIRLWHLTFGTDRARRGRNLYSREKNLGDRLVGLAGQLMGRDSSELYLKRRLDPSNKSIDLAILGHIAETANGELSFDPVKEYTKQLKKVTGVKYSKRTVASPRQPLYPNDIRLEGVDEGDRLFIVLDSHDCMYLTPEFTTDGLRGMEVSRSAAVNTYSPGSIQAAENSLVLSVKVRNKEDGGIRPRWYGIQTPPGVDNWSASKLFDLMGDGFREAMDGIYGVLEATDKKLEDMASNVDDAKKKLRAVMAVINKVFKSIEDVNSALRKFIESLSLTNLPTVYVAMWRGGANDIPRIVQQALIEKRWLNSTYGGVIIFGAESAANTFLKTWKEIRDVKDDVSNMKSQIDRQNDLSKFHTARMDSKLDTYKESVEGSVDKIKELFSPQFRTPVFPVIGEQVALLEVRDETDLESVFEILENLKASGSASRYSSVERGASTRHIIPVRTEEEE